MKELVLSGVSASEGMVAGILVQCESESYDFTSRETGNSDHEGVLVIVDLGGAETNSEMAIEMLGEDMRKNIQICDAPIVEGAIMAATEASSGASLEIVRKIAEDINHE